MKLDNVRIDGNGSAPDRPKLNRRQRRAQAAFTRSAKRADDRLNEARAAAFEELQSWHADYGAELGAFGDDIFRKVVASIVKNRVFKEGFVANKVNNLIAQGFQGDNSDTDALLANEQGTKSEESASESASERT